MNTTDFTQLSNWAELNLQKLQQIESIRRTTATNYPQDIEISLRNLKDEYHKIILACEDHTTKLERATRLSASEQSRLQLSAEEQKIADKLAKESQL